jgi:hypothetical protein
MCHGSSFAVSLNQCCIIGEPEVALLEDISLLRSPSLEGDEMRVADDEQLCMPCFKFPQGDTLDC